MKLSIMQPYFFPYSGYFSLIKSVDKFVFYDDVDFIKNGWINRNRLFLSGDVKYFTIPLSGASSNLKINEIICQPRKLWERKMLASIEQSYSKAPYFHEVFKLIKDVLDSSGDHISEISKNSVIKTANYLNLDTTLINSSSKYFNSELCGTDRVIDICLQENASKYINSPGGKSLYDAATFECNGLTLEFLSSNMNVYKQFNREFISGLSIIDMLMFNDVDRCNNLLLVS
jgi:hypothetical protein